MAGTGTSSDPYIVTTYTDLIAKIANPDSLSEVFIKIGADINITEEYPFGDMPVMDLHNHKTNIDGDGHEITNWYYIGNSDMITCANDRTKETNIKNLRFTNIVFKPNSSSKVFLKADSVASNNYDQPAFENCEFVGISYANFMQWSMYGDFKAFRQCSFNIFFDGSSNSLTGSTGGIPFESCYVRITSNRTGAGTPILQNNGGYTIAYIPSNSYFELIFPNVQTDAQPYACTCQFDNCVIYLDTPGGSEYGSKGQFGNSAGVTGLSLSIINLSHATGWEVKSDAKNLTAVTDQNWHDISYLQSIGFKAGVRA